MDGNLTYWRGEPLDSYSKEELIEIVVEIAQLGKQNSQEHLRQLKYLAKLNK